MFALQDVIHVDAAMWSLIVSVIIPPIVGFFTTLNTSSFVKSVINVFLNLINVVLATVITVGDDAIISKQTVITAALAFLTSRAAYKDFYKAKGITSSLVLVPSLLPNVTGETAMVAVPGSLADVGVKAA